MPSRTRAWTVAAVTVAAAAAPTAAAQAAGGSGFTLSTAHPEQKGFAPAFVGNGYLAGRQPAEGQGYAVVPLAGPDRPAHPVAGPGLLREGVRARHRAHRAARRAAGLVDPRLRRRQRPLRARPRDGPPLPPDPRPPHRHADHARALDLARRPHRRPALRRHARPRPPACRARAAAGRAALRRPYRADRPARRARGGAHPCRRAADSGAPSSGRTSSAGAWGSGPPSRSALRVGGRTPRRVASGGRRSAAQRVVVHARSGRPIVATKSVGVAVAGDAGASGPPHRRALAAARARPASATRSRAALRRRLGSALAVRHRRSPATRASSARSARRSSPCSPASATTMPWAPSPGGLSSDGYNGHVFWDSETWMYPSLLADAPALARHMLRYRFDRLGRGAPLRAPDRLRRRAVPVGERALGRRGDAELLQHRQVRDPCQRRHRARASGSTGWPPATAAGSRPAPGRWCRDRRLLGQPLQPNADGTRSINCVIPPDEYAERVDDSVYTNVGARDVARDRRRRSPAPAGRADPNGRAVARRAADPVRRRRGPAPRVRAATPATRSSRPTSRCSPIRGRSRSPRR